MQQINMRVQPTNHFWSAAGVLATIILSACRSCPFTACASPDPVRYAATNCAPCDITARKIDAISDHLYGRRNSRSLTNVRLYGTAAIVET